MSASSSSRMRSMTLSVHDIDNRKPLFRNQTGSWPNLILFWTSTCAFSIEKAVNLLHRSWMWACSGHFQVCTGTKKASRREGASTIGSVHKHLNVGHLHRLSGDLEFPAEHIEHRCM